MRERMLAGELYIADDPELGRGTRAPALTTGSTRWTPTDREPPTRLLDRAAGRVGEGTEIRPPFYCDYGYQTSIGARTFANFGLVCLDVGAVTIGDDVQIGPNVQLLTADPPGRARARAATSGRRPSRSPSATTSGSAAA